MPQILRFGSEGALVSFLQAALNRYGAALAVDGVFGAATQSAVRRFQRAYGLQPDGVVGAATHRALQPWYEGYFIRVVRRGDTLYSIARAAGTTLRALETANPGVDPLTLRVGERLTVPYGFPVLPEGVPASSFLVESVLRGLAARYPFLALETYGRSALGKPLWYAELGAGENRVYYNAAHHANEWITTLLLLRFLETLCDAAAGDGTVAGRNARELLRICTLRVAPAVNPDGIDLVTGAAADVSGPRRLAANYPGIPFPSGWKANWNGVDPNLQYPAGWAEARRMKFAQGYTLPGPRDYVGQGPLTIPESLALFQDTLAFDPALTIAYHTQGRVIYWNYANLAPAESLPIARRFAALSGYTPSLTSDESGNAGYKDWFIQDFRRPGFTIEAGEGENPLPLSQLPEIWRDNVGILVEGMVATAGG